MKLLSEDFLPSSCVHTHCRWCEQLHCGYVQHSITVATM